MNVAAEIVLPCPELGPTMRFFTDRLGFRIDVVFPADDPRVVVLSGAGVRIRLDADADASSGSGVLQLTGPADRAGEEIAPNGTRIRWVSESMVVPDLVPSFTLTRAGDDWGTGRAGMQYRDLIPGRQGGRFIASHIRIPDGGPVSDWVHFHEIRFQVIVVRRGWVEVVYEDQGDPFVMQPGDCVLQPPQIRHRVLRASDGLEVIELGCPAEHRTVADHELGLPTGRVDPDRDFSGQRFAHHRATEVPWEPWRHDGFDARDAGIGAATGGLAGVRFVRPAGGAGVTGGASSLACHAGELAFAFVMDGSITLVVDELEHRLGPADAVVVPAGAEYRWSAPTTDLELLDVTLPEGI